MRRKLTVVWLLFGIAVTAAAAENRGVTVRLRVGNRELPLYEESHALIIGASRYKAGWPSLPGVKRDVDLVQKALAGQGFTTRVVLDPTRLQFEEAVKDFVADYGQQLQARLLIYFAGHGHTLTTGDGRQLGYILPVDTPRPSPSTGPFKRYAVSMTDIETIAVQIESKHVLFVFDSCFSGSIFDAARSIPDVISEKTARPVRQFITAGSAEQTVPDKSVFRGQFIDGINGEADANGDGYVTGSELGEFLQSKVTNYTRKAQTPEYGKIVRAGLDKGDFVFDLGLRNVPGSPVVVRGRGLEITQSEFETFARNLPEYERPLETPEKKQKYATDYSLVRLLAARGRAVGLASGEQQQQELQVQVDRALASVLSGRLWAEERATAEASEDVLRAYYNAHHDEYTAVESRGIAIAFGEPEKPERTEAQARAKAERIRAEILGGADFGAVATRESDDPESGANGGRIPTRRCRDWGSELEKLCFEARPGSVEVTRTEGGYVVFLIDRRTTLPYSEVRKNIVLTETMRRFYKRTAALQTKAGVITPENAELGTMRRIENLVLAIAARAVGIDREPAVVAELRVVAENFVAEAERNQMKRGIVITQNEIDQYYREHRTDFESAETRSIEIAFKGAPPQSYHRMPKLTENEARLKAERLRNELLAGASFEKLAAAENDADDEYLGTVLRGVRLREIEEAVFNTPAGTIAPLVRTYNHYIIIRVDDRTIPTLQTVQPKIDEILRNGKLQVLLDALVDSAELYFDPVYFASR